MFSTVKYVGKDIYLQRLVEVEKIVESHISGSCKNVEH